MKAYNPTKCKSEDLVARKKEGITRKDVSKDLLRMLKPPRKLPNRHKMMIIKKINQREGGSQLRTKKGVSRWQLVI